MSDTIKPRMLVFEVTGPQKEAVLLHIIEAAGGETDSSESKWSWITWFCGDEREGYDEDTFNRCHTKGWLHTTYDSDTDHSVTTLTTAGREALAASTASESSPSYTDGDNNGG